MAKPRYNSVSAEDNVDASKGRLAGDDRDATLYEFDMDERREEDDERRSTEKADSVDAAETKPTAELSKLRRPTEASEDEADDENAVESGSHGFHPARLFASSSSSLLHSSSSSSPLSRFASFLRLNLNRYYVVLLVALLAISCSGTLLRELPNTPPLLKGQLISHHSTTGDSCGASMADQACCDIAVCGGQLSGVCCS